MTKHYQIWTLINPLSSRASQLEVSYTMHVQADSIARRLWMMIKGRPSTPCLLTDIPTHLDGTVKRNISNEGHYSRFHCGTAH